MSRGLPEMNYIRVLALSMKRKTYALRFVAEMSSATL